MGDLASASKDKITLLALDSTSSSGLTITDNFSTGATGHIGGDLLYAVSQAHPDWNITALVRTKEKAVNVTSKYPRVNVVLGDLNSKDVIEEEVKKADIVFGATYHTPEKPLWLIHTSGTGILAFEDRPRYGSNTIGVNWPKKYDDWNGVRELLNLPDDALHRNVDKIIIGVGPKSPDSVKVAIVCPPTIYRQGRGTGNTKSIQVYRLAAAMLQRKNGFLIGEGKNIWHQVHVQDLGNVYLALGGSAALGGGKATWNSDDGGYFLAGDGSFIWGDIQGAVAQVAYGKKLIDSPEAEQLGYDQVAAVNEFGPRLWGTNSRGQAIHARKLFGWRPQQPKLLDLIPEIVDIKAQAED